ncbi:hypothetical protein IX39_12780 [Chryseobacterium formosense]|uniref:DUF3828 domain-containing protein n=1 Tax=Chryseobacterium formosense TaxID=236814 RepID=A0A085Z1K3_9FLAO|nr:hypothetical protein [Chryseobacterium formosense]KFE98316.1 hypothetical protein IX39_12780 [Chryseobacterium formosense]SFT86225.1 hypothetical protein SAMN05421857_3752 [Chryseobacterium formosense]
MKVIKCILILLIFFSISCCVNQQKKDEEQIKETVVKYWKFVKEKDFESYLKLMGDFDNAGFDAVYSYDLAFLNRNYRKLETNQTLSKITVKDTVVMGSNQKYVKYIVYNHSSKPPLEITLFFYKQAGYDKIFNVQILGNMPEWEKE